MEGGGGGGGGQARGGGGCGDDDTKGMRLLSRGAAAVDVILFQNTFYV